MPLSEHHSEWIASPEGEPDEQFLGDLVALNAFKSFLVGSGVEVDKEVLSGLAGLSTAFSYECRMYEKKEYEKHKRKTSMCRFVKEFFLG